jgi:hypothetical protein
MWRLTSRAKMSHVKRFRDTKRKYCGRKKWTIQSMKCLWVGSGQKRRMVRWRRLFSCQGVVYLSIYLNPCRISGGSWVDRNQENASCELCDAIRISWPPPSTTKQRSKLQPRVSMIEWPKRITDGRAICIRVRRGGTRYCGIR